MRTPGRERGFHRRRHPLYLDFRALSDPARVVDDDPFVRTEILHRPQTIILVADSYQAPFDDVLTVHDEYGLVLHHGLFRHQNGLVWCARDHPHADEHPRQKQAVWIWN
jgi:hypothetical protein